MIHSTQSFTQSLRLLDPVNQKRIKLRQRILWPDYETLNLLNTFSQNSQNTFTNIDLANLFLYSPFQENFTLKKTNKIEYLNLKQLYSDQFTHLAFWICKQKSHSQKNKLAIRSTESKRQKSLEKMYESKDEVQTKPDQIYLILCKRPMAIDQIAKTAHKVCISIASLSGQKFLWGGALHYEQFESLEHQKKQQCGLFKTGGQSFGFKIDSKPSFVPHSYRKSNGLIDKRQQRYSNYFKAQKEEPKSIQTERVRKQCSNKIKILPQHIRQHQQLLYIQLDLSNSSQLPERSDQYRFVSIDIYARHFKPRYGGVYQRQSTSSDSEDEFNQRKGALNKYKKLLKQEIFLVYSMPFMEFNSYLESQLNYQQSQQLRQINFRGSCLMFSAMKKLQLKSNKNSQNQGQKENQFSSDFLQNHKKQRYLQIQQEKSHFVKQQKLIKDIISTVNKETQKKKEIEQREIKDSQKYEIVSIFPEQINYQKYQDKVSKSQKIRNQKRQIVKELIKILNQTQKCEQNRQDEIFVPVFNPEGFEPLRIGVDRRYMRFLNPQIDKKVAKVFVESDRIKKQYQSEIQRQQRDRKRLSVYIGKKRGEKNVERQKNLIGIDVFLSDKVYRQQEVWMLIRVMKELDRLRKSDSFYIEQADLNIETKQELKNLLTLLSDIKGQCLDRENSSNDLVRLVLWVQMLQRMNQHSWSQINLIRQVQKQTYQLIRQTSELTLHDRQQLDEKDLYFKQQQIIRKIQDYHCKFTLHSQSLKPYLETFFYFFTELIQNNDFIVGQLLSRQDHTQNIENNQQPTHFLQQLFNQFLLLNCKLMFETNSLNLSDIIQKLSSSINPNHQNNSQSSLHRKLLCQLLKTSITFVIKNLFSVPINIFLSEPLEQFEQQIQCEHQNQKICQGQFEFVDREAKPIFGYRRLRRFLKKYFIKGHDFLDRQANQSLIDGNNTYMSLVTDLLNLYIKIISLERSLQNDSDSDRDRRVLNVIELVKEQYNKSVISSMGINFNKQIKRQDSGVINEKIERFESIQKNVQKIGRQIQRKQKQVFQYRGEWNVNNLSYWIDWNGQLNKKINRININNQTNKPIKLSEITNEESQKYNFNLIIQTKNNNNNNKNKQQSQIQSSICFYPSPLKDNNKNQNTNNSSYSVDIVKSCFGLDYHQTQNIIFKDNKSLFTCYEVFIKVQIITTTNKSSIYSSFFKQKQPTQKQSSSQPSHTKLIILKASNLLIFENFNHSPINKNLIQLHLSNQDKSVLQSQLTNIQQVNIKIYSKNLTILSASLSFINLRLGKYLKNLLKKTTIKQSTKSISKSTNRKTIGARYTQHLNNRKSVQSIEQNIFFGQSQRKSKNNNQMSTLFDLPQILLFDILRVDKSYIQDQQKILHFIDEFYQRNQPQYSDYILYLCVRPNFIRVSTLLKHYFENKLKYQDSKVLNSILKTKLKSSSLANKQNDSISQLFIKKPRISSYKPLKNILDTNQQRQLLNKYMKDLTRKSSLQKKQHSQSISKPNLFTKKSIFQIKQQRKQNPKDIQI